MVKRKRGGGLMHNFTRMILFCFFAVAFHQAVAAAFTPGRSAVVCRSAPIMGIPFVGRFRKKQDVEISDPISIGSPLPEVDIEVISNGEAKPMTISEALGGGKTILVGMPGAFTPTCSEKHLPGYVDAAPKLAKLGVNKIAVVTTNDRFVNEAWAKASGIADEDDEERKKMEGTLTLVSDGDGELVRKIGLAEDMGFGVGVRSKRFALVVQDGKASYLTVDDGMDSCDTTSAETLVRALTPTSTEEGEVELDSNVLAAVGGAAAVLLAFMLFSQGNDSPSSGGGFSLLNDFL